MHEYGIPPRDSGIIDEDILNEESKGGSQIFDSNMLTSDRIEKHRFMFNPVEYSGEISQKYKDDQLIFSEQLSSTKIYLTHNQETQEDTVKKVILKDRLFNQIAHEFAQRECMVHYSMNHENVIELYEYCDTKEEYQLYMEFADQTDYLSRKILDDLSPITNEDKLRSWATDTLQALNHIHNQGVIHVDLKLENLLIQSSEREDEYPIAKLCDFGLCHLIDHNLNNKSSMDILCGTQGYMAPEQKQVLFYLFILTFIIEILD
eukprot:403332662